MVVGEHDLDKPGDEQAQHDVKEIIIHPKFNESTFEYDFAILRLVNSVTISKKAAIISLPNENLTDLSSKAVILFGWGLNENNETSSKLKSIEMEVLTNLVCQSSFEISKVRISILTNNHICALRKHKGSGTCNGDSGGINAIY